ncbi:hypothetical protein SAMN04488589_0651 [Methanolobus vulcani]|uniref:DUF429 domain-containing protein n=1 Tax=Methanolobus vulcani TaxID=38026 RepID=A0A7Z7AVB4_9EURY|nr:hypothetical protein [Methanolobus vulcani]SDF48169.1 hypothetical protein SAMN04488589_0651 [Methanolobus vulcani]
MDFAATGKERRIFGVDFSGAKDAGRKIWISEGVVSDNILHIHQCYPIFEVVPDNSKQRDVCLSALRDLILSNNNSVFGMDFPFSLPHKLMSGKDWCSFVSGFPDEYESADDFRKKMQQMGGKTELKRLTDVEVKAPFSIYNLWVYKQTYFGIHDVLRPLVTEDKACAVPMQEPECEKPWLMEICPASTLKSEDLYIGYKGRTEKEEIKRKHILDKLIEKGMIVSDDIKEKIIRNKDGDALDSFVAAYATYRSVLKMNDIIGKLPDIYLREGYTFF